MDNPNSNNNILFLRGRGNCCQGLGDEFKATRVHQTCFVYLEKSLTNEVGVCFSVVSDRDWTQIEVPIDPDVTALLIVVINYYSSEGEIGIDDVELINGPCPSTGQNFFAQGENGRQ